MASTEPGLKTTSGLQIRKKVPTAAASPWLLAAANPTLDAFAITVALGFNDRTTSRVPSVDALSTTINSHVPSASVLRRESMQPWITVWLFQVTTITEITGF